MRLMYNEVCSLKYSWKIKKGTIVEKKALEFPERFEVSTGFQKGYYMRITSTKIKPLIVRENLVLHLNRAKLNSWEYDHNLGEISIIHWRSSNTQEADNCWIFPNLQNTWIDHKLIKNTPQSLAWIYKLLDIKEVPYLYSSQTTAA